MVENNIVRILYWDSCVFLSHINGMPERIQTITDIINEISENDKSIILTSSESIVEVAHAIYEKKQNRLDPEIERTLDEMWADSSVVKIIDNGTHIARLGRSLIRQSIPNGWKLTPKDAIHLASAMWHNRNVRKIDEFHTYDDKLNKFQTMIGIQIGHPHVLQYRMNFEEES
jgi:predicted nucleic acid-binding protein